MTNGENMGWNPSQQKIAEAAAAVGDAEAALAKARQQLNDLTNPPLPVEPVAEGSVIRVRLRLHQESESKWYVAVRGDNRWHLAGPGVTTQWKSWAELVDWITSAYQVNSSPMLLRGDRALHGFTASLS